MAENVANVRPKVGTYYMVPCLLVGPEFRTSWMPADGWVPVLGPKHRDVEHLEFEYEHFHVDWRFMPRGKYETLIATRASGSPLGNVVTSDTGYGEVTGTPKLRRVLCKREMPEFPSREGATSAWGDDVSFKWKRMERAQAFTCNRLKPGNICPHRGIDLTPFIKEDGTVICPGHGLRWDTKTGALLPHHAAEVAHA